MKKLLLLVLLTACAPIRTAPTEKGFDELVNEQRWCFLYVSQIAEYKTFKACHRDMDDCLADQRLKNSGPRQRVLSQCFRLDGGQEL